MTGVEKQARGFFARRTDLDELGRPHAVHEQIPMSPEEREVVPSLRDAWFGRQRQFVASLHARYPYLPWVVRAIRELDAGRLLEHRTWRERHGRTKKDLAELKRLQGRSLEYLKHREYEVGQRWWKANLIVRHTTKTRPWVARAIDEEELRACPDCEQLVVPSHDDYRYQVGYCPFCGSSDRVITIEAAEAAGLVEPDREGFWRVRHGQVPGFAPRPEAASPRRATVCTSHAYPGLGTGIHRAMPTTIPPAEGSLGGEVSSSTAASLQTRSSPPLRSQVVPQ